MKKLHSCDWCEKINTENKYCSLRCRLMRSERMRRISVNSYWLKQDGWTWERISKELKVDEETLKELYDNFNREIWKPVISNREAWKQFEK